MTEEPVKDNVVPLFPGVVPDIEKIRNLQTPTNDEMRNQSAEAAMKFVQIMIENLMLAGIDIADITKANDLAFMMETISSYISKQYGIYHPLQDLAGEIFEIRGDGIVYLRTKNLKQLTDVEKTTQNDDP